MLIFPAAAFAHQPRLATGSLILVSDPEVSKAYYDTLAGVPAVYRIVANKPFTLYVNVLVPDIAGQKKDVSAVIVKDGTELATLDGATYTWKQFFEPFGHDSYWMGPEYRSQANAGSYEIRVWSSNNDSKYSLAIGETEAFDFKETMNALTLIPQLKKNFFNESPATFIFSPFGWGLILSMYVLAFAFGLIYRLILKRIARSMLRKVGKNIGVSDRIIRLALGLALLAWAITTTWSPLILFFSGFCLFEAMFSWCGLYAAIGKSTCPIG